MDENSLYAFSFVLRLMNFRTDAQIQFEQNN
jgi:hypothetical protein